MARHREVAVGLDVGTGGARAIAVDYRGEVVARGSVNFDTAATVVCTPHVEQSPRAWTDAAAGALTQLTSALTSAHSVVGIAVDATSGSFLLADQANQPLTAGIMYNDLRADETSLAAAAKLDVVLDPFGIRMAPSFALPKIFQLLRTGPKLRDRCRRVVHQTDWLIGMLCGRYDTTDISSALKTGANPQNLQWPEQIEQLGLTRTMLPRIVLPGTPIGQVTPEAARMTGLPRGVPVVAGCTDGTAGCLASGAADPGDLNVTLGSTLVFKAVASQPLHDPDATIYNHRHPAGGYLPGAASSTGAEWTTNWFDPADLDALGADAVRHLPSGRTVYPLIKTGERFPFRCAHAHGFRPPDIADPAQLLAAGMEGVAFIERLGIDRLQQLGLAIGPTVFATGGATASDTWLRIRASVNRRCYCLPRTPECAVGAAVLAALPAAGSYQNAASRIVRRGRTVEPDARLAAAYDAGYEQFQAALVEHGFMRR